MQTRQTEVFNVVFHSHSKVISKHLNGAKIEEMKNERRKTKDNNNETKEKGNMKRFEEKYKRHNKYHLVICVMRCV